MVDRFSKKKKKKQVNKSVPRYPGHHRITEGRPDHLETYVPSIFCIAVVLLNTTRWFPFDPASIRSYSVHEVPTMEPAPYMLLATSQGVPSRIIFSSLPHIFLEGWELVLGCGLGKHFADAVNATSAMVL